MDLRQLRYFVEIVEQGSITRAAERLGVAQPALSLHIKNMEDRLGTRLLNRSRAGVTPTEAGNILLKRARTILDDLARTEDEIRTLDTDPAGVVKIGLPGTISGLIALPLIEAARERFPRITITVAEAMSGFIADWLADGRVDLAVLYAASDQADATSEFLVEEELVVLWPPEKSHAKSITLDQLGGVPMILPSSAHGLRQQVERELRPMGIVPNIAVEIDSYSNIKQLVAAGYGASILPLHAVQKEHHDGHLSISRINPPGMWRGVHMIYPTTRPVTRAQDAVRDLVRQVVREMTTQGKWGGARPKPD